MGNQQSGAGGGAGKVNIIAIWPNRVRVRDKKNCYISSSLIVQLPQDKGENKEKKKYEPPVPTRFELYGIEDGE